MLPEAHLVRPIACAVVIVTNAMVFRIMHEHAAMYTVDSGFSVVEQIIKYYINQSNSTTQF